MTGVSHQPGQECDHPVERVIEDLVRSVRRADVDGGCPHHDLGENPVMRRRGCECLHDVSVVLPPADVPGIPEL